MKRAGASMVCFLRKAPSLHAAPQHTFCTHGAPSLLADFPAVPGTLLRVVSAISPVDIKARTGADMAHLQAPMGSGWSWKVLEPSGDTGPMIDVSEARGRASLAGGLQATIPDKWVSVDVCTAGQPVSVQKLVEANLSVQSQGGDVSLGQVRTYSVTIDTRGGERCGRLQGGEVSGSDVALLVGSAPLTLQRLVGQRVRVEAAGQPMNIRALYAEQIEARTGGGNIDLGNLDVSEGAILHSQGGNITVHSLDGNCTLESDGGDIEVHLHSKVGAVGLMSGGGAVRVAVSPQASVEVAVQGSGQVTCTDAGQEVDQGMDGRVYRFRPNSSQQPTRYGQLSEGRVVVQSGAGAVEIVRVGWMEALKQRLAQTPP